MDTPAAITGLDAASKLQCQVVLERVWERYELTIVLTTHDAREAVYLADVVHVMAPSPSRSVPVADVEGGPLPTHRTPELRGSPEFARLTVEIEDLVTVHATPP